MNMVNGIEAGTQETVTVTGTKKNDNNEKLKCVSVSFDSREIQQMNPFSLKCLLIYKYDNYSDV